MLSIGWACKIRFLVFAFYVYHSPVIRIFSSSTCHQKIEDSFWGLLSLSLQITKMKHSDFNYFYSFHCHSMLTCGNYCQSHSLFTRFGFSTSNFHIQAFYRHKVVCASFPNPTAATKSWRNSSIARQTRLLKFSKYLSENINGII